jgi:parvulin-like peptidyl-prolyl isomerase
MEDFLQACVQSERLEEGAKALSEHLEHLRRAGQGPDSEIQVHFRGMLGKMADQQTAGLIQPEEILRYHSENRNSFRETSLHLQMITILREEGQEARAAQRKEVEAWRERIANGTPFAEIAKLHSEDPYKDEGGDRGKVERGQTLFDGHLEKAIFATKPGIPVIHESEKLLWILKVEDRREGEVAPLEQVREEIKGILAKPLREKLLKEWIEEGRKVVAGGEQEPIKGIPEKK